MNVRSFWILSFAVAAGVVTTMSGCGGSGASRTVPLVDERALDSAVLRSQAETAGTVAYGVINGPWEPPPAKSGKVLLDGEEVLPPPDDSLPSEATPLSVAPDATATNCSSFVGDVPPPCTSTGEFRRVYSGPGYSYALARLVLPDSAGMQNITGSNGDAGFIYFEGWPLANKSAPSEVGFQYSAVNDWYTPYYRTSSPKAYGYATYTLDNYVHYKAGQTVTFALGAYTISGKPYLHVAILGTVAGKGTCTVAGGTTQTTLCLAHGHFPDQNWTDSGCCIMGRMTTIAQTPAAFFYDGAKFGPITWSGAELAKTAPTPAPGSTILPITGNQPAWAGGGNQNWPPLENKIVVTNESITGESDTLDMYPLPDVSLAMKPATCQHFASNSGTVATTLTLNGDPGSLPIEYGWQYPLLGNPAKGESVVLTVPGSAVLKNNTPPGSEDETTWYVGKKSTSGTLAVTIAPINGYEAAFPIAAALYFIDPTGKLTASWNGKPIAASKLMTLGNADCPGTH